MAVSIQTITDEITKQKDGDIIIYYYKGVGTVKITGSIINVPYDVGFGSTVQFDDLDTASKQGQTDAESLGDYWAANNFWSAASASGGGGDVTIVADSVGLSKEAKQDTQITEAQTTNTNLSSIDSKLTSDPATETKQDDIINAINNSSSSITFADSPNLDAFGRLRVSEVTTQLDIKYTRQDKNDLFVDEEVINGGSTSVTGSELTMSTSASGEQIIRQTFQRGVYQSGKSAEIYRTFRDFETVNNGEKLIGYFSASTTTPFSANKDGIVLRSDGTTIYAETYNDGTVTSSVARADWFDKLDGTGSSGLNIDFDKNVIWNCDFEWLSYGRVRHFVVVNGLKIPFCQVVFVNGSYRLDNTGTWVAINAGFTSPYMQSPNQPFREELRQTGAGSNTFVQTCSTFGTEGGLNQVGQVLSENVGSDFINANSTGTTYAILGIGLQAGKTNTSVLTINHEALAVTNDDFIWKLLLNPTVAGTFTYNSVTNSSIEVAKGATNGSNTVTGGTLLQSGYGEGNSLVTQIVDNAIKIGESIAGVRDKIVLCVEPLSTNLDIYGSLTWKEFN